jgi:hypothetical protein
MEILLLFYWGQHILSPISIRKKFEEDHLSFQTLRKIGEMICCPHFIKQVEEDGRNSLQYK